MIMPYVTMLHVGEYIFFEMRFLFSFYSGMYLFPFSLSIVSCNCCETISFSATNTV